MVKCIGLVIIHFWIQSILFLSYFVKMSGWHLFVSKCVGGNVYPSFLFLFAYFVIFVVLLNLARILIYLCNYVQPFTLFFVRKFAVSFWVSVCIPLSALCDQGDVFYFVSEFVCCRRLNFFYFVLFPNSEGMLK